MKIFAQNVLQKKQHMKLGLGAYEHVYNSIWEVEAGGPMIQDQPGLHDNLLWRKKKTKFLNVFSSFQNIDLPGNIAGKDIFTALPKKNHTFVITCISKEQSHNWGKFW